MRPSDPIKPMVDNGTVATLSLLVRHRKAAYLDAIQKGIDAEHIGKRWRLYKEAREALASARFRNERMRRR